MLAETDAPLHVATGSLDLVRHALVRPDGQRVRLTTREAALLGYLGGRDGRAVDRDQILVEVFGYSELSLTRALDATVARLRRKIEVDPASPRVLVTVHGHGYRLVCGDGPAYEEPVVHVPARAPLVLGPVRVDLVVGEVTGPAGSDRLTNRERIILEELLRAAGAWVDLAAYADVLGLPRGNGLSNAMYRLRAKIDPEGRFLESQRGSGYRLATAPIERTASSEAHRRALGTLAHHVGHLLGFGDCVVYLRVGDAFEQVAASGRKRAPDGSVVRPLRQRVGEGIVGACVAASDSVRVDDLATDPRYVRDLFDARSELAVPIVVGGEVMGVIDSESPEPRRYTDRDEIVFLSLATIASAAFSPAPGGAP